MTEHDVRELFDEVASTLGPTDLADAAWATARRRRSLGRAAGAAAAAVAAVLVAVAVSPGAPDRHDRSGGPSPSPATTLSRVTAAPARAVEDALPLTASPLPHLMTTGDVTTPLSADPPPYAVALLETWGSSATPGPVVVVGADQRERRIDGAHLQMVDDGSGNRLAPLRPGSLSPDGRRAAFPQRDAVVVVDLTTGAAVRRTAPGYNRDVTWSADGSQVMVSQPSGALLLDVATGSMHALVEESGQGKVLLFGGASATFEQQGVTAQLQVTGPDGTSTVTEVSHVTEWYGPAYGSVGRVARSGYGDATASGGTANGQVLAVVDTGTPTNQRLLGFDWAGRDKDCCAVLGWLDGRTVLFASTGGGTPAHVMAWQPDTSQVTRVSTFPAQTVISLGGLGRS